MNIRKYQNSNASLNKKTKAYFMQSYFILQVVCIITENIAQLNSLKPWRIVMMLLQLLLQKISKIRETIKQVSISHLSSISMKLDQFKDINRFTNSELLSDKNDCRLIKS